MENEAICAFYAESAYAFACPCVLTRRLFMRTLHILLLFPGLASAQLSGCQSRLVSLTQVSSLVIQEWLAASGRHTGQFGVVVAAE